MTGVHKRINREIYHTLERLGAELGEGPISR